MAKFMELDGENIVKYRENKDLAEKLSAKFRGEIIECFSVLEVSMELAIAEYFTGCHAYKSHQLIYALLSQDGFNFNNKRRLIHFISENGFPEFFNKNKTLDKKISNINKFRNQLAHRKLDTLPDALLNFDGKNIGLVNFTTDKNRIMPDTIIVNQQKVDEEIDRIKKIFFIIADLTALIRKS